MGGRGTGWWKGHRWKGHSQVEGSQLGGRVTARWKGHSQVERGWSVWVGRVRVWWESTRIGETTSLYPRMLEKPDSPPNCPLSLHAAEIQSQLHMLSPGQGGFTVFVGLSGSREELGLEPINYFMFPGNDLDGM